MRELMQGLAPLFGSDVAIGLVVLALFVWAALSALKLWKGTARLAQSLDGATSRIEQTADAASFAAEYSDVSADLARDEVLGGRWEEFNDSLVAMRDPVDHVRSTARCDHWFNLSLLRVKQIDVDPRFHAAMPNLLVGAGLLFTFLGLAAALSSASGVMAGDALDRNVALKNLLDAASAKFITSLVGLFLSIAYAILRKSRLALVEQALDRFATALEKRAPLLTPIELQQKANGISDQQLAATQGLANELSFAMAQALDERFDRRLGEHIGPLTEAIQKLAGELSTQSTDAMERMTEAFLQKLQGGAGERMQDVVASLERLSERLDGLQSGLGDAAIRMAQSADTMAARMGEGAEAALTRITDQMGGLAETLRGVAEETRGAGAQAGRELAERLGATAGAFETAAGSMTTAITRAAEDSRARMAREAEDSAGRLGQKVEAMVGQLGQLAEDSRAAGHETMQAVADRVASAASGFEATAGRAAEALERAVLRLREFERAAGEATRPLAASSADLRAASEAARSAVEPLGGVAQTIGRAAEQISGTGQRLEGAQAATGRLVESLAGAVGRFEGLDRELAKVLGELQVGLQGFSEQVTKSVRQTDENLAKAAGQLGSAVKGLEEVLEPLIDAMPLANGGAPAANGQGARRP